MTAIELCRTLRVSRTYHLAQSTLHVLAYLTEQTGAARLTDIAEELGVSTAAITGTVDQLEKLKLVRRHYSAKDRRVIICEITSAGADALATCLNPRPHAKPAPGLRLTR